MIKKAANKKMNIGTQRFALRGTNRGTHRYFHAG